MRHRLNQFLIAPWPSYVAALSIPLLYLFQIQVRDQPALIANFGLSATGLRAGQWQELLTFQIVHASWVHVGGNAFFALLFAVTCGGAMTRLLGAGPRGVAAFFGFYVFCGILSGIAFVVANLGGEFAVIGASGAVSGLLGASARVWGSNGRVGPILTPAVFLVTVAFMTLNLSIVLVGPDATWSSADDMPVAWITHVAGYLAGLFLIGPWAVVLGEPHLEREGEPYAEAFDPEPVAAVEPAPEPLVPLDEGLADGPA
ncbi:MAG TPA: rhomboid family intramembrane serine protease [Caulobacteraceae bacterium]|jgi:membrane associated rhomboid family serine protease|nr:rhomboid family intramembrane serine protease [Caulobacteraceae bacterium]